MVTPEVISVKFGDPSINSRIQNRKDTVTSTERAPASLSLEIVKDIWRKYPKVPTPLETGTRPGSAAVVQPTAPASNALELNLGARRGNEVLGGSPTTPSSNKSDGLTTGIADRESVVLTMGSVQTESPASERAVDELLPISPDTMEMSPAVPHGPSKDSLQVDEKEGDRLLISTSPNPANPSIKTGIRSIQDVRSMLLDLTWKATQRRYPDKNITYEQFSAQFAQKMSDAEVRDFVQTGKVVIEGLRRSGQLEEAKRKYLSEDNGDEQRRTRRRLDSSSPRPVAVPQASLQDRRSISGSRDPSPSTSVPLNTVPPVAPKAMLSTSSKDIPIPRAPRAMLSNNWRDAPAPQPTLQTTEQPVASQNRWTPQPEEQSSPCRKPADSRTPTSEVSHLAPSPPPIGQPSSIPPTAGSTTNDAVNEASSHGHDPPSGTHEIDGHAASIPPSESKPSPDSCAARILLAKVGLSSMGLLNASFDLDERLFAAIRRWAERSNRFDPTDLSMKLYLLGISTTAAQKASDARPPNAQPSFLAERVSQLDVTWPQPGTLYVSLNKDRPESISWAEVFFGTSSPALDLSGVVVEGTNEIQFVQLEDHSHTVFIVLAIQPNEDELQEAMTLHSRRKSWVQLSHSQQSKSHVKLQFDASSEELAL